MAGAEPIPGVWYSYETAQYFEATTPTPPGGRHWRDRDGNIVIVQPSIMGITTPKGGQDEGV